MTSTLTRNQIDAICRKACSRFPELKGVRPRVTSQRIKGEERFLLTFKTTVPLPDGGSLPTIVRAVADSNGKILKLSSSR